MDDKEELEELCKSSIKQRIHDMKAHFYGGGFGESTKLKYLIQRLTGLDFEFVRHAIDSLDDCLGWTRKSNKWKEYYDYIHPPSYKEKGYTENYFIIEYGGRLSDFLWNEWKNGHIHKFYQPHEVYSYKTRWWQNHPCFFESDGKGGKTTQVPDDIKCRTCGKWVRTKIITIKNCEGENKKGQPCKKKIPKCHDKFCWWHK